MSDQPSETTRADGLKEALKQISSSLSVVAAERAQINEVLKAVKEKYGIQPKLFRKVALIHFRQAATEFESESGEVLKLHEEILKPQ